jgi:exopolysaccharide biosynthesis protein
MVMIPSDTDPRDRRAIKRRKQAARRRLALAVLLIVVAAVVALAITLSGGDKATGVATSSTGRPGSLSTSSSATDSSQRSATDTAAGDTTTSSAGSSAGADTTRTTGAVTDTSYKDATKSITITKASMGSGSDKVTYFVIDIKLTSAKDLRAGLADNAAGAAFTSEIAAANNAVFAINGDYFRDRTDGIVIRNGVVYRDKPARMGAALYADGTLKVYDETKTSAAQLVAGGVWHTFSFGPVLLVNGAVPVPDVLGSYEVVPNPQYPIQGSHPRTGIGLIGPNHFVLIDVDGRHPGYSRGATLEEFAQMFKRLGCTTAYNIDGGASATVYFRGNVINQPKNHTADPVQERATSDILFLR